MSTRSYYVLGLAATVGTVLVLLFGIGALGIIGAGGRPDRIYLIVLVVLVVGVAGSLLRPRGLTVALLATALTQVVVSATALVGPVDGVEDASRGDVVTITAMYAVMFCLCAGLFHRAAGGWRSGVLSGRRPSAAGSA